MKNANFTQNEIAALIAYDQRALFDSIKFLAANGKLRRGHDVRFIDAANKLNSAQRLTHDEKHYFLRMTPYDGVMFITLYHKQLTEFLTEKYSAMRARLVNATLPERMLESRAARWARQGQEIGDAKAGVGGKLRYDIAQASTREIDVKADSDSKVIRKYKQAKAQRANA